MAAKKKKTGTSPATALVVAASGGVGEAVARQLCADGYTVIGTCRTAAQARQLLSRGVCHHVVQIDLDDFESIEKGFKSLDGLGIERLDALMYCAGVTHAAPLEQEPIADMRRLFEVNVFAALRVIQLALPHLLQSQGRIVLIGSSSGGLGLPMLGAYSASKFALEGLADSLRRELSEQGIHVSLVVPGGIKTAMTEQQLKAVTDDIDALGEDSRKKTGVLYRRHQQLLNLVDKTARSPDSIASFAISALKDAKPKARYFCGIDQRLIRTAVNFLPDGVLDELLPNLLDLAGGRKSDQKDGSSPSSLWRREDMNQLSSFDALMVYGETSRTPMHVSPFFIYDVSTAPNGAVRFKDILRTFEQRIDLAPILRRKLVRVPFDLDDPYWADDPDFDVEQHIRHVALPKPGDRRQLQILLARLTAYPMDLTRPAWDAFVIEGLDNVSGVPKGAFGLLLRIHHAAIDGHSGHGVLQVLHDLTPVAPKPKKPKRSEMVAAPMPSTTQMLTRAYYHLIGKPRKLATVMAKSITAAQRAKSVKKENPGEERTVPETRFSGKVSSHRVVVLLNLDMESLRPVRQLVAGSTFNDVIVSVISGAMRKYLKAKKELPKQSMSTGMPINIRTDADKDKPGNVVSLSSLNMHSDIEDPVQRIEAIHASAVYSKAYHNAIGARIMADVAESIPAGITALGTRVASTAGLMDKLPVNTVITNVPGPQVPLYMSGAKVVEFHAVGIVLDGLGIFHSVNSYCGMAAITVYADRYMLPDPAFYEECLRSSYDEHIAAATKPKAAKRRTAVRSQVTTKPPLKRVASSHPAVAAAQKIPAPKKSANVTHLRPGVAATSITNAATSKTVRKRAQAKTA